MCGFTWPNFSWSSTRLVLPDRMRQGPLRLKKYESYQKHTTNTWSQRLVDALVRGTKLSRS